MSIIAAGTTTTTALSSTGNTDGTLQFQVNGTTPSVTLNTLGAVGVGSSPNFGSSGQVLTSAGSTAAPTWATPAPVNLATGVTGTLPVANGGTGATTLTANNVLLGNGTSALQVVAPGASGNVLTSNGTTWTSASPAGGSYTVRSSNYTAVAGDNILANTSGGSFIITLPASPATGAVVNIADAVGSFSTNPLEIARNGSTIMSLAESMFVSTNDAAFQLVFNGSTWRVI